MKFSRLQADIVGPTLLGLLRQGQISRGEKGLGQRPGD